MSERTTATLHLLVSSLDAYADELLGARYGATFNLFEFLAKVGELDHPDVTTLARYLRLSKAAVSKRLPGLVTAGWVVTLTDASHARRVRIALTEKGAAFVDEAGRLLDDEFGALLAEVRGVDPAILARQLSDIFEAVEKRRGGGHLISEPDRPHA